MLPSWVELIDVQAGHLAIVVFKKEDKELKEANKRLADRREAFRKGELDQDMSALGMKAQPCTWVRLYLQRMMTR